MKITFYGAARTVTGSMHHLHVNGENYLMDCGLFQGHRKEAAERNTNFPFPPSSIKAVLLSHAHIDHSGNLPQLVKRGFYGPIYTTPATIDLCKPMLADSAHLQESDADFLNRRTARRRRIGAPDPTPLIEPLYTSEDAEKTQPLFRPVELGHATEVGDGVVYKSIEAGHMLGSTSMTVELNENGKKVTLGFSGDVGRKNLPIIRDPQSLPPADYLIMESTYGDRLHEPDQPVRQKLADVINRTSNRGGKIIVPSFAVGRTQQLVLLIHQLIEANEIGNLPVFVDSPLAVNTTDVFKKHQECYDEETAQFLASGKDPFGFKRLTYIRDVADSKALNDLRGPMVIISASGMCEAGRILHHLKNNIENPRNTVLITGFQAENTLGRKIVEKQAEVNIFGEPYRLRAEVVQLSELSGHADQHELLEWMSPMMSRVKKVWLVHGEPRAQEPLAALIRERFKVECTNPARGDSFDL
ncbi:MAG TPA: MBL fold metallo-hydrolase [Bryobacteraceae bacterium]|jgi:metallo-beta-lactamase family protein